jgi:hypothetical protein
MMRSRTERDDLLIDGTSIPVHQIAALRATMTAEEVVEDYPGLSLRQVHGAIAGSSVCTRSFPELTLKRGLSELVTLGVFDDKF